MNTGMIVKLSHPILNTGIVWSIRDDPSFYDSEPVESEGQEKHQKHYWSRLNITAVNVIAGETSREADRVMRVSLVES